MVTGQAPRMRVHLSRDTNKKTTRWVAFLFVGGGGGSLIKPLTQCFYEYFLVHFQLYAPNYAPR